MLGHNPPEHVGPLADHNAECWHTSLSPPVRWYPTLQLYVAMSYTLVPFVDTISPLGKAGGGPQSIARARGERRVLDSFQIAVQLLTLANWQLSRPLAALLTHALLVTIQPVSIKAGVSGYVIQPCAGLKTNIAIGRSWRDATVNGYMYKETHISAHSWCNMITSDIRSQEGDCSDQWPSS